MTQIISLFDYLGFTLRPWAEAGYECFAYDLKHKHPRAQDGIHFEPWDARDDEQLAALIDRHSSPHLVVGFPPCTDLAVSGSRHWMQKSILDPNFQQKAMDLVRIIPYIANRTNAHIWFLENPVGAISRLWRDADFWFHPYEYGDYLSPSDFHPIWPDYIPPQDAYMKKTGIWCNHKFKMPPPLPVRPYKSTGGVSTVQAATGGKSSKTKEIRSATPRGFARAVFLYNQGSPR